MTMHLERGLTTLNTRRPKKKKLTLAQIDKYSKQLKMHNKDMRRLGCHDLQMDLDTFIAYIRGELKPRATSTNRTEPIYTRPQQGTDRIVETKNLDQFAPALKKDSLQYTGTRRLVGIATMHKSNMVPIFADDDDKTGSKQATDIAQMRRN